MRRVVIVICDGHRDDFVRPELCPAICGLEQKGRRFRGHRGIYPSATRASVASFATGAWPAAHGLAGNTVALDHGEGLVLFDSGAPEIVDALRRSQGRTLSRPTTSERVTAATGDGRHALIVSNGSPGAALLHDPDHAGLLLHRSGSFGPGGERRPAPDGIAGKDAAADAAATELFCAALRAEPAPRYAVLWLCEPDTTMHASELGSTEHLAAIAAADACVGRVARTVGDVRAKGDDVLFLVGSDHGQETVAEAIPVERLLIDAGLKDGPDSRELVVAPQGSGGHVFLLPEAGDRARRLEAFFRDHDWCGAVFAGAALESVGQRFGRHLALSFSMRKYTAPNRLGVPGVTDVVTSAAKPAKPEGFGSHGGFGLYESRPFLVAEGGGFAAGSTEWGRTSLVDVAPTALRHLGLVRDRLDGLALPPD